jgi:alkanesulfonate monooxygenase
MEQCLEVINRLWTEDKVDGDYPPYKLRGAVLYPKPVQKPRPPILIGGYVDAVLKRAATKGDGWLTYYYTAESFARAWAKVRGFAEEAGRNPDELISTNQLPICIGPRAKIEAPMKHWLQTEWDYASWSESTMESAIMGTVEECVEQLGPTSTPASTASSSSLQSTRRSRWRPVAREIIPRLKSKAR